MPETSDTPDTPGDPHTPGSPSAPDALVRLLGTAPRELADLGGSDRSHVWRVTLADGRTVVAKQFLGDDAPTAFLREQVGLSHLSRTPALLASDDDAHLLVMSDAGTGRTLADHLLGDDPDDAWAHAIAWSGALGDLVGNTIRRLPQIREELAGTSFYDPAPALREGVATLARLTGSDPEAVADDLARVLDLVADDRFDVAWPTDTCPDNAVTTPDGWIFLDLEGTDVNHAALVAAYPALPFATCWCVFDPPRDLTDQMLASFTLSLSGHAPHITDRREWRAEIDVAAAAWVLANTAWLTPRALDGDGPIGPTDRSPTRRQLLRSRWHWLATHLPRQLPALAALGAAAAAWAEQEWGETASALPAYPAFAQDHPAQEPEPGLEDV